MRNCKSVFLQYCKSNVALFSIAPQCTYRSSNFAIAKVVALINPFASFLYRFLYIDTWLLYSYYFPYYSCRSFCFCLLFAIAFNSDKYRRRVMERSKVIIPKIQQRRFRAIALQGAIQKSPILLSHYGGTNNILAFCILLLSQI